jgi:hypothetical protein
MSTIGWYIHHLGHDWNTAYIQGFGKHKEVLNINQFKTELSSIVFNTTILDYE